MRVWQANTKEGNQTRVGDDTQMDKKKRNQSQEDKSEDVESLEAHKKKQILN